MPHAKKVYNNPRMGDESKEQEGGREESPERLADKVFEIILYKVMADTVDNEGIRAFRREVDPQTGLANSVLLARAYEDFNSLDGKIVITHSQDTGPKDPFVVPDEFILQLSDQQGKIISEKPNVVGILLNPNSNACKRRKDGGFEISNEDLYSVLKAVVWVQSLMEQKRADGTYEQVVSRRDFEQTMESG